MIVKQGREGDFARSYSEFMQAFNEAMDKTSALSRSRPNEGGLFIAGDITSERMNYLAAHLLELHERALDAAEKVGKRCVAAENLRRLMNAGSRLSHLESECKMYAAYLGDRGDPEVLDEDELSRLVYLPRTGGYAIGGQKTTWKDVFRDLFRAFNPFNPFKGFRDLI